MRMVGFYSLINCNPAPIVPIFSKDLGPPYFAQDIGEDGNIIGFIEATVLDKERLVSWGKEYSEVDVGAKAIFALQINSEHIVANNSESIKRDIRDYLYANRNGNALFASLDLSLFLGDSALIEEYAERCRRHLEATAPRITRRWIDGAPLSIALKQKLHNRQIELDGSEAPKSSPVRLGFTGYSELMSGLTLYCAMHLGGRATALRRILEQRNSSRLLRDSSAWIDVVIDGMVQRYSNHPDEIGIEAWMVSRGRVDFVAFDENALSISLDNFYRSVEYSDSYRRFSTRPYFIRGREFKNFVLTNCILMSSFSGYADHYNSMLRKPLHSRK